MSEVLTKISALQESSKQTQQDAVSTKIAEASHLAAANNAEVEIYRKKMEELEKQLSGLTQQRLDYLEKLHQQQLDIQVGSIMLYT
jgi:Hedgehog signalling target